MTSSGQAQVPLAVIDPALGGSGAHNRGFAEMLGTFDPALTGIWCANSIAPELAGSLRAGGMLVEPAFTIDFYALFHRTGGVAGNWDWIYQLARDYQRALEGVLARWGHGPVRVLHHTLSWEHATALSLALDMLGATGDRLWHLALLMYSPGVSQDGSILDPRRWADFLAGFAPLDGRKNVTLHAGCSEHAAAYAVLLHRDRPLPVHPCFLGTWRQRPQSGATRERGRVLAYVGEPKQEKGFLGLPVRLARMTREQPDPGARFVVHCASLRTEAASQVVAEVEGLARSDPRIEVHVGFWNDDRLRQELARAEVLCLDYDSDAYAHKTSGLLWLAAWHDVPVRIPRGSWLEREGRRLGMALVDGHKAPRARNARRRGRVEEEYWRAIFHPFDEWLQEQPPRVEAERPIPHDATPPGIELVRATVARAAMRPPMVPDGMGADVVMFWKQNDSTLYGRRNDMVARYLASRADVRRVLVVDSPISDARLATFASGGELEQQRWIHLRTLEKLGGERDTARLQHRVFVYPAAELGDDAHEHAEGEFVDAYARFLRDLFAREGIEPSRSVYWVYPREFSLPSLLERLPPGRLVVDVVDDHRAWPGVADRQKARFTDNYRDLLARADLALANCAPVQAAMRSFHPDVRLVPNGCDPGGGPAGEAPPWPEHPGRTIGFAGNLEAKIDVALLDRVATHFPQHQLVLVGSTHANPAVRELARHANVILAGVVPYDRIGDWIAHFDVGLIPHLDMALTRSMNPLKAHVYLAWGVPVVSTAVANVAADGELVRMAVSHDAFLYQIERVLAEGRPSADRFREHIRANDWRSRLEAHVDALHLNGLASP